MSTPHVFESFWRSSPEGVDSFDHANFLSRLLLFDTVIIDAPNLFEVPPIVHLLGLKPTIELIENGTLRFICDPLTHGSIGPTLPEGGPTLPPNQFSVRVIRVFDPPGKPTHISQKLESLLGIEGLSHRETKKLKSVIGVRAQRYPSTYGTDSVGAALNDVEVGSVAFRAAIAGWFERKRKERADPARIEVNMKRVSQDVVEITSNVGLVYSVEPRLERKALEAALLDITALNEAFECMKVFNCVTPFSESELSLFDARLRFFERQFSQPAERLRELDKVLVALELPSFEEAAASKRINVQKLLEVRNCDEARIFRDWLANARALPEEELAKLAQNLRARIGRAIGTNTGKVIRFLISSGLGAISGPLAPIVSTAFSALDGFVFDRVFKSPGLVTFFQRDLRSLFHD
ncbi:MAG: hypothetical protein U1E65_03500 [Myxococcota bacterium]